MMPIFYGMVVGSIIVTVFWGRKFIKKYAELDGNIYKYQLYFITACKWIHINQQKCSIRHWFLKHNYKSVIIYGIGELGKLLIYELEKTDVNVVCGVDQNDLKVSGIQIMKPDDSIPSADVIIVTPIFCYERIKKMLQIKTNCRIVSVEQLFAETLFMGREDDYDSK